MTTATFAVPTAPRLAARAGEVDSRAAYLGFAFAYLFGHGASALSKGDNPLVPLPGWLPMALLIAGLAAGTVFATLAALRAQKGLSGPEAFSGKLIGAAWVIGMAGLALTINGLHALPGMPNVHSMLWPAGAGFVVGLLYLGEGAVRRNVLHYVLGSYLTLISSAALFLGAPGLFWVLAIAGTGGFLVAAVLEHRRLAAVTAAG
ncbi:ABC transporter permease [Crossiella sp. SN42]|uniref:ABC transporter permease n=1 Tax=Crossiella sp. SN42 TaxID=2944808 RepID=UPI00207C1D0E|nr:ABC transporter permease [Crossiella sp. SN42]MCO1582134.1 ABC transporter permease [Crossiella sp. SN42]